MRVPDLVQVDAFTDRPFRGNPAGVCLLDREPDDAWMQDVAAEVHVSETAFLYPEAPGRWGLRWFTPQVEVDLCGHATLAAAHELFARSEAPGGTLRFSTRSGELTATRAEDGWIELDFPADPPVPIDPPRALLEALEARSVAVGTARARHYDLVELTSAEAVRELEPNIAALRLVEARAVIVTAVGDGLHDCVSRVFGPRVGIDEDPVTGSAHCVLGPFWAPRLDKRDLLCHQASRRGGTVRVGVRDDRVLLGGRCVTTFRMTLDDAALPT